MSAVILLCRGPLGAEAVDQLHVLQHMFDQYQAAGQQNPVVDTAYINADTAAISPTVQLAFIDRRAPSLPEALDACREHASVRIPLPDEPALRRWMRDGWQYPSRACLCCCIHPWPYKLKKTARDRLA